MRWRICILNVTLASFYFLRVRLYSNNMLPPHLPRQSWLFTRQFDLFSARKPGSDIGKQLNCLMKSLET